MSVLADHNLPFAVALVLMVLIAIAQAGGFSDLFADADSHFDGDGASGTGDGLMALLGLGRVPFLVWLAVYLLGFAGFGVAAQFSAETLAGAPLSPWLASAIAGAMALPVTSVLTRTLGHILPQDETTAVSLETLVGRRAIIIDGRAAKGFPARAKVCDRHGHPHYVMVEPHDDAREIISGEEVLLVRRQGPIFFAVAVTERLLASES